MKTLNSVRFQRHRGKGMLAREQKEIICKNLALLAEACASVGPDRLDPTVTLYGLDGPIGSRAISPYDFTDGSIVFPYELTDAFSVSIWSDFAPCGESPQLDDVMSSDRPSSFRQVVLSHYMDIVEASLDDWIAKHADSPFLQTKECRTFQKLRFPDGSISSHAADYVEMKKAAIVIAGAELALMEHLKNDEQALHEFLDMKWENEFVKNESLTCDMTMTNDPVDRKVSIFLDASPECENATARELVVRFTHDEFLNPELFARGLRCGLAEIAAESMLPAAEENTASPSL